MPSSASGRFLPPESPIATWLKKRLLLESLVAALPPDVPAPSGGAASDGITCDFLLKLLRAGRMVGADAALLQDLEACAARRLDQATLAAVMIPAFGHACGTTTLLDVPLVLRLVRRFLKDNSAANGAGGAAARVARLVDAYLAEAALESGLRPAELEDLARAVPVHARAADDALYRAVDTLRASSLSPSASRSLYGEGRARASTARRANGPCLGSPEARSCRHGTARRTGRAVPARPSYGPRHDGLVPGRPDPARVSPLEVRKRDGSFIE